MSGVASIEGIRTTFTATTIPNQEAAAVLGCTGLGGADSDVKDTDCTQVSWYRDEDDDGYGSPADVEQGCDRPAGYAENDADCDDANPEVNPEAAEVCGNDADDNCHGEADGCGLTGEIDLGRSDVEVSGSAGSPFGTVLTGLGDINGDGNDDLLIGSPGTSLSAGKAHMVFGGGF